MWDCHDETQVLKEEQNFENSRMMEVKYPFALEHKFKQEIDLHLGIFTKKGTPDVEQIQSEKKTDTYPVNCPPVSLCGLFERDVDEGSITDEVKTSRENLESKQKNHASRNTQFDSDMLHRSGENGAGLSDFRLSSTPIIEIIRSEKCSEILNTVTDELGRGQNFNVTPLSYVTLKSHMTELFKCNDCGTIVNYFSHLKRHINSHLEITENGKCSETQSTVRKRQHKTGYKKARSFKCDTCNVDLHSLSCVQSHLKTHVPGKLYECDDCGRNDIYFSSLKRHINSHLKTQLYISRSLNSTFSSKSMAKRQKLEQNSEKCYKCDVCSLTFLSRSGLVRHKRKHMQEETYISSRVDYSSKSILKRKPAHTVDQMYACDLCGVILSNKTNVLRHKKLHAKQKLYQCDMCGLGFAYSSNMYEHRRSHTGEKPFSCHICSASFSCKSNMLKHERVHTKEKPFLCDVCGAAFAWPWHLTEHKRTHTGEKPYKCDICGVKFAAHGHLKKHKVIHTGERNYKCDTCGGRFSRQTNLRSHERIHKRKT